MQVLVIEDEVCLAEAVEQILSEEKYGVDVVHDGEDGLEYAKSGNYDVIILDVMLPKLDGFQVVKQLRDAQNSTPVLMLTARDNIADKVAGLDCGADDYMTKPFVADEFLARVRALSRRQGAVLLEEVSFCDLTLNLTNHELSSGEKSVHLGFKEFEVLKILMANQHRVTSKDDLITKVWGVDSNADDNNVEAYISFLRKKFFFLGSCVTVGTVRKVGYILEEQKK